MQYNTCKADSRITNGLIHIKRTRLSIRHFVELFLFFAHNLLENSLINLATHVFSSFIFYGYIQL